MEASFDRSVSVAVVFSHVDLMSFDIVLMSFRVVLRLFSAALDRIFKMVKLLKLVKNIYKISFGPNQLIIPVENDHFIQNGNK